MYRRNGVISRSFNSPHGVTINDVKGSAGGAKGKGVKRKFSWHGGRVRNAFSEGVLTHRPVVLKEGYLNKPSFFRFGGRKRRWCVLRTYNQTEATLDLYQDETKSRYKGSISLDKEANPLLMVKNMEKKRKASRNCYLSLKVSKTTYQFATDSFRELKEWCALIRQAMDNGSTFSGKLTEPNNIEDGMVNVKFNSNCISLLCPIKEMPLKTWRLDHITSFGQSGGILTFECCSTCSDPSASRCAINIVQEKPTTILNIMERAIRSNPNTSEIHYERSILGDIYHCGHDCTQPRLIHGVSDPSLFRSTSASPQKGFFITADVHRDIFGVPPIPPSCTLDSNDSGLPGTPQTEEALSEASSIPSPTGSNKSNPSFKPKERGSPYRSPKHVHNGHQGVFKARSMSDSRPSPQAGDDLKYYARRQSDELQHHFNDEPRKMNGEVVTSPHHPRLQYAMISHEPPKLIKREPDTVSYAILKTSPEKRQQSSSPVLPRYSRLRPLDENDDEQIYDEPCDLIDNPFSPTPSRKGSGSRPERSPKISMQSSGSYYAPGSDLHERTEDFQELPPPVPPHQRASKAKQQPQINVVPVRTENQKSTRRRLQSSSDILEASSTRQCNSLEGLRSRGSMDNLDQLGRNRSNSVAVAGSGFANRELKGSLDLLARLHEEEEKMTKVLNASKWKPNEEMLERRDRLGELNRPYKFNLSDLEFDNPDPDMIFETTSNLADYHSRQLYSAPSSVDKVLTKVASNTVRGYAYKINIPVANTQYDVPRRAAHAPVPDLAHVRADAPPKPVRYTSSENLHFFN